MTRRGRKRAGEVDVRLPTWKIAELAGVSPRTVQRAIRRGELDRRVESVITWLLGRWSVEGLRSNREEREDGEPSV